MPGIEELSLDGRVLCEEPTWEEIEEAFAELAEHGTSTLGLTNLTEDAFVIVAAVADLGLFLIARQADERGEMQLVQPERGDALVEARIADHLERHPRFVFVQRELALVALREFCTRLKRTPQVEWMDPREISERYALDRT